MFIVALIFYVVFLTGGALIFQQNPALGFDFRWILGFDYSIWLAYICLYAISVLMAFFVTQSLITWQIGNQPDQQWRTRAEWLLRNQRSWLSIGLRNSGYITFVDYLVASAGFGLAIGSALIGATTSWFFFLGIATGIAGINSLMLNNTYKKYSSGLLNSAEADNDEWQSPTTVKIVN
jgi:hypothetical protein